MLFHNSITAAVVPNPAGVAHPRRGAGGAENFGFLMKSDTEQTNFSALRLKVRHPIH